MPPNSEKPPALGNSVLKYGSGRGFVNVFNSVESRTTIVSNQTHGARVQKGDVLCELDAGDLRDRLAIQAIAIQSAEAEVQAAKLTQEAAEIAANGYTQGFFPQELASVHREIKLAEANLTSAEDALEWARRMFNKGYVSMAGKVSEELRFKKDQFALELAQSKLNVLVNHTRNKTIKELSSAVETARAHELARQAALERERSIKKRLDDQIRRCKVVAPVSGFLHHVTPIGPGAVVRDGQRLFQIEPEGDSVKKSE